MSRYPKVSLRDRLTGLSTTKFANLISEPLVAGSISTYVDAGSFAIIMPIEKVNQTRIDLNRLALRPALLTRERDNCELEPSAVAASVDAFIADSIEDIEYLKAQTFGAIDIILFSPTDESDDLSLDIRKRAIAAGAKAILVYKVRQKIHSEVKVYLDDKPLSSPIIVSYVLRPEDLPAPLEKTPSSLLSKSLVKVCGIKTLGAAEVALENGADMIGMILVPNRARTVDTATAIRISEYVRSFSSSSATILPEPGQLLSDYIANRRRRPQIVGVFRNQPLSTILKLQQELSLDIVQLHGDEPLDWCRIIPVPVIKRFTPNTPLFEECLIPGYFEYALLDSELGGEGKLMDRSSISEVVKKGARFILAGGLTPENVALATQVKGVIGVDVSGGVETGGVKDLEKVKNFVLNARQCS